MQGIPAFVYYYSRHGHSQATTPARRQHDSTKVSPHTQPRTTPRATQQSPPQPIPSKPVLTKSFSLSDTLPDTFSGRFGHGRMMFCCSTDLGMGHCVLGCNVYFHQLPDDEAKRLRRVRVSLHPSPPLPPLRPTHQDLPLTPPSSSLSLHTMAMSARL